MTVYLFGRILHGEGSIGAPGEEEIKKPGTTGIADALQELLRRTEGATPPASTPIGRKRTIRRLPISARSPLIREAVSASTPRAKGAGDSLGPLSAEAFSVSEPTAESLLSLPDPDGRSATASAADLRC